MIKLDAKFEGTIVKVKNGAEVPPDEWMVFLAKDDAFLPTLVFYRQQCVRLGADQAQVAAVDRTILRVRKWREAHPDRCKIPDAKDEKLLG